MLQQPGQPAAAAKPPAMLMLRPVRPARKPALTARPVMVIVFSKNSHLSCLLCFDIY